MVTAMTIAPWKISSGIGFTCSGFCAVCGLYCASLSATYFLHDVIVSCIDLLLPIAQYISFSSSAMTGVPSGYAVAKSFFISSACIGVQCDAILLAVVMPSTGGFFSSGFGASTCFGSSTFSDCCGFCGVTFRSACSSVPSSSDVYGMPPSSSGNASRKACAIATFFNIVIGLVDHSDLPVLYSLMYTSCLNGCSQSLRSMVTTAFIC